MKRAIVTGATSGIGCAIAKMLLGEGFFVTITYGHDDEKADVCRTEMLTISENFEILKIVQTSESDMRYLIDHLKEQSEINCIICNAGISIRGGLCDITNDIWNTVLQTNLSSHFFLIRDLYDIIPNNSRIIFIGSQMGIHPHALSIPYGVSKAAVHSLALNLVKFFEGTGTTVNVIAPGFVETEWHKNKPLQIRKNIVSKTAIHRFGFVDEIAQAAKLIINNGAVNGAIINIDGGYNYKENNVNL